MCDVVYALWVQRLEADVRVAQQAALLVGADLPDLDACLTAFDAALLAEPKRMDPDELELRRALGLRHAD